MGGPKTLDEPVAVGLRLPTAIRTLIDLEIAGSAPRKHGWARKSER